MKTENFQNQKPQQQHAEFTKDFCAGYDATTEKISHYTVDAVKAEFNLANPTGFKPSSMAAYFYAKGEMAAILDAQ